MTLAHALALGLGLVACAASCTSSPAPTTAPPTPRTIYEAPEGARLEPLSYGDGYYELDRKGRTLCIVDARGHATEVAMPRKAWDM